MQQRRNNMNNLTIINHNGQPVADSREVAIATDKQHPHLLRDIKGYESILEDNPNLDSRQFFIKSTYINEQNKEQPCYLLTRYGLKLYIDSCRKTPKLQNVINLYNEAFGECVNTIVLSSRFEDSFINLRIFL
jgi:Rha family phage regulatory protein